MCHLGLSRPTPSKPVLSPIFILLSLVFFTPLQAAEVTLAWDPNTEPDIAGYKLYYGTPVGTYSSVQDVGNATDTTVSDLLTGRTYAFYVTCYNTSGLESEPSNVVQYTVPTAGGGNQAPLAFSQVTSAAPGQEVEILLLGQDGDGDPLSFNLSSFPSIGTITDYAANSGSSAIVTYIAPAGAVGQDQFTFTVDDGFVTSPEATVTINLITDDPGSGSGFLVAIEAESASLQAPLSTFSEATASAGGYIATPTSNDGAATFEFNIPVEGDYIVWCRVKTPSGANDSFIVTLDQDPSTTDIYDASEEYFGEDWHWTPLAGRGGADQPYTQAYSLSPRVFHLTAGSHSLAFEGREQNTGLDAILVTGDTQFDAAAAAEYRITSLTPNAEGGVRLEWPAFPGVNYRVYANDKLGLPAWAPLPGIVTATTTRAVYVDVTVTSVPHRFYRLEVLP